MKVISVDDSESVTTHIKELIESTKGVTFSGRALSKKQALELIQKVNPEIIFLDIFLKDENGLELLAYLKINNPDIIVIMLTNNNELIYKNKAKQLGAYAFLDKSYEFDKIPQLLDNIAKNRN